MRGRNAFPGGLADGYRFGDLRSGARRIRQCRSVLRATRTRQRPVPQSADSPERLQHIIDADQLRGRSVVNAPPEAAFSSTLAATSSGTSIREYRS